MYNRINLQYLCSFVLDGTELIPQDEPNSIEKAYAIAYKALKDLSEGKITYLKAEDNLNVTLAMHETHCVEIGMKLGARMISQLLNEKI